MMSTGLKNTEMEGLISRADSMLLKKQAADSSVSHAYLFYGAGTELQKKAVRAFIAELINSSGSDTAFASERLEKGSFSDILEIDNDGTSIKIDEIRKLISFLSVAPSELKYRIAVVYSASKMTVQAQNALLKTLEEPGGSAVAVLASASKDGLLLTVLSRVQPVLLESSGSEENPEDLSDFFARLEKILLTGDIGNLFRAGEVLSKDGAFRQLLYMLHKEFTQIAAAKMSGKEEYSSDPIRSLASNISASCALNFTKIILDTLKQLEQNAPAQLAAEVMLIRMREDFNAENSWNKI